MLPNIPTNDKKTKQNPIQIRLTQNAGVSRYPWSTAKEEMSVDGDGDRDGDSGDWCQEERSLAGARAGGGVDKDYASDLQYRQGYNKGQLQNNSYFSTHKYKILIILTTTIITIPIIHHLTPTLTPTTPKTTTKPPNPHPPNLTLNLSQFTFIDPLAALEQNQTIAQYGLDVRIQVGGGFDLGVGRLVDFGGLERGIGEGIGYQVVEFGEGEGVGDSEGEVVGMLKMDQFKDDKQRKQYIRNITKTQHDNTQNYPDDPQYNLAIELIRDPHNTSTLQCEYYLADRKYAIGSKTTQIPICILSGHHNIYTKNRYKQYFESLQRLNYSNFHIVYIDDASTDNSTMEIYRYLEERGSRLRGRVRLVRNYGSVGWLGNMYYHSRWHCGEDDVVVVIDADDGVIGRQGFKILSALYQNPDTWYLYSQYIIYDPDTESIYRGTQSTYLPYKSHQYRRQFTWQTSHMRTFRLKLMNSVPIHSFIEYVLNKQTMTAQPRFYESAGDLFQTFAHIELAGNYRVVHIDEFLYQYYGSSRTAGSCYREREIYCDFLSRLKTPFRPLRGLGDVAEQVEDYNVTYQNFVQIKNQLKEIEKCQKEALEKANSNEEEQQEQQEEENQQKKQEQQNQQQNQQQTQQKQQDGQGQQAQQTKQDQQVEESQQSSQAKHQQQVKYQQ